MSTKSDVLSLLAGESDWLSGEVIAGKLDISRNAVWKAIGSLRDDGYEIEAVKNRGYRLAERPDIVSEPEISRWLTQDRIGSRMEIHGLLDSTNKRAKELAAEGAPHGFLVAADEQSAGRGRFDRRFFSPAKAGIYISYVLRPTLPVEKAVMLTSMAAVAVARAIESLAEVEVKIKWVNDLYINGRKVCGILCEAGMDVESGFLAYAVLGIGVNVGKISFPEELKEIAASIENETGKPVSRSRLIAAISNQLDRLYPQLKTGEFMEEYRRRSNVIGSEVTVLGSEEGPYQALAVDIDERGRLAVQLADGSVNYLNAGEISVRRAKG